ncbi:hypothetical protein BUALT_Bualt19G0105100 [Buddleja alternifolia]|uniref:Uncharacterized protein n=1 Tax=Buddleja alternifolia TaxID=168488 RepID=A0AAV6WB79_9LAMI|nr:hypothetical protein BUALT_Bualt19G0105100 [Buddleja alternifolia]
MSWWWAGAIGAAKKKFEEDEAPPKHQSVALIIGVTGIVGNSLAEILPLADTTATNSSSSELAAASSSFTVYTSTACFSTNGGSGAIADHAGITDSVVVESSGSSHRSSGAGYFSVSISR